MSRPVVETRQGQLRGVQLRDHDGKEFFGFKGVPYAKPPVGQLRFEVRKNIFEFVDGKKKFAFNN